MTKTDPDPSNTSILLGPLPGWITTGSAESLEDAAFRSGAALAYLHRRCCTTLTLEDSHRESMRLDMPDEQAKTRPLPHDELVQLHCGASQAGLIADLAGQGDDLARAA